MQEPHESDMGIAELDRRTAEEALVKAIPFGDRSVNMLNHGDAAVVVRELDALQLGLAKSYATTLRQLFVASAQENDGDRSALGLLAPALQPL